MIVAMHGFNNFAFSSMLYPTTSKIMAVTDVVRIFSTLWYTPPKGLSKTARITFDNPAIIPRILAINAGVFNALKNSFFTSIFSPFSTCPSIPIYTLNPNNSPAISRTAIRERFSLPQRLVYNG